MVRTTIALLAVAFASVVTPVFAQNATATAPALMSTAPPAPELEDPAVRKRVVAEFHAWQRGKIVRARYTAAANRKLTPAVVAAFAGPLRSLGTVTDVAYQSKFHKDGDDYYLYSLTCTKGTESVGIGFTHDGAIDYVGFKQL